jgi:hypothetical protein
MQHAASDHSEQYVAILAVIFALILTRYGKSIIEGEPRYLKAYSMPGKILRRLGIVPLECMILHTTA